MKRSILAVLVSLSAVLALPALAADKPSQDLAATIGAKDGAKWTDTTTAAAATADQQKHLKKGKPATVVGEVIDVSCYAQLGKRGDKHIACGTKCLQNGNPAGILDDKGNVYTLFVEQHDPRRDGLVDLKATFIPLLAKRVQVSGMLVEEKSVKALYVDQAALTPPAAPAAAPAK
jgi:hypothetical protein